MIKTWQKILATVLVLGFALFAIYFLVFTKVALVSDESFSLNMKNYSFWNLRFELAKKGARLSIVNVDTSRLTNPENIKGIILNLSNKNVVLFSPVMTAVCDSLEVEVSSLLNKTVTAGISNYDNGNFDIILKSENIEPSEGEVDYRKSLSDDRATIIIMPDLERAFFELLEIKKTDIITEMGTLYYEKRSLR